MSSQARLDVGSLDELQQVYRRLGEAVLGAGQGGAEHAGQRYWTSACVEARVEALGEMLPILDALIAHPYTDPERRERAVQKRRWVRAQHGLATGRALPWVERRPGPAGSAEPFALFQVAAAQPGPDELRGRYGRLADAMVAAGYPDVLDWGTASGVRDFLIVDPVDGAPEAEVPWVIQGRNVVEAYVELVDATAFGLGPAGRGEEVERDGLAG